MGTTSRVMSDTSQVAAQLRAHRAALEARLAQVRHVVAVMSGKGGVGKSAVTANLAAALAADGARVGALDADLSGQSLALLLGVRAQRLALTDGGVRPAIGAADVRVMSMDLWMRGDASPLTWDHVGGLAADTFVWRGLVEANALRELAADTAWGALDYLLVDLPPGTDRFDTTWRILPRLDAVVAVTTPSEVSLLVVRKAIRGVQTAGAPLGGLVVNMAGARCADCGALVPLFGPVGAAEIMAAEMGTSVLGAVPFDAALNAACESGLPLVLTQPEAEASRAIRGIAAGLRGYLDGRTTDGHDLVEALRPARAEPVPELGMGPGGLS